MAIIVLIVGCSVAGLAAVRAAAAAAGAVRLATSALTIIAFLWPADFYYHYAGFLAPFLALAIALPVARFADALRASRAAGAGHGPRWRR